MKYSFYSKKAILEVFKTYNGVLQKRLGQNFFIDPNYVEKIFDIILKKIPKKVTLLEIGPGLGALSHLLKDEYDLYCVEIDPLLCKVLHQHYPEIHLFNTDILKFFQETKENKFSYIVGNLPYYITTEILIKVLHLNHKKPIKSIFLVQKEYAEKLLEKNNSISIYVHNFATINKIFSVPKESFFPMPKVESTLIELDFYPEPKCDHVILEKILRMSFRGKRKKIQNSWKMGEALISYETLYQKAEILGINLNLRAEQIQPSIFYELALQIQKA